MKYSKNKKYDNEGFLVEKKQNNGVWKYFWTAGGMLKAVQRPDGSVISFKYDAFGRRIEKKNARATTHFVWDGNVPLHEWKTFDYRETIDNDYVTWVFKDFVPIAKLQGGKSYSIISDHLGTPILAIDTNGVKVWERELDIYGKVRKLQGDKWFMPFLYQGQYYDNEVDLAYNRFRYYDCNTGSYINQDPIRLAGNNPTLYGYVFDNNVEVDIFGLIAQVYRLVATKDGYYDLKQYGKPTIKKGVFLKEGETWKIGETIQFNKKGKQKRYSETWLQTENLRYEVILHSDKKSDKKNFQKIETAEIDKHIQKFGKRPAGNSCRH